MFLDFLVIIWLYNDVFSKWFLVSISWPKHGNSMYNTDCSQTQANYGQPSFVESYSPAIKKKSFKSQGSAKGSNMIRLFFPKKNWTANECKWAISPWLWAHDPVAFSCKVGMTSYLVISCDIWCFVGSCVLLLLITAATLSLCVSRYLKTSVGCIGVWYCLIILYSIIFNNDF